MPKFPKISSGKKLRKPIKMSVEERTSGLLKEGRDYKTGPEGEYISLKDKEPKKLRKPISMSVEERTSGLLKEGRDYKTGSEGEYISLKDENPEKYAKGGLVRKAIARGCGKVMSNRRKTTKYF